MPVYLDAKSLAFGRTPALLAAAPEAAPRETDAEMLGRLEAEVGDDLRRFYDGDDHLTAGVRAGLLLLFAVSTGCYDPMELARRTGYPLGHVSVMAARAVDNGIWQDGMTYGPGWDDEEYGGFAFCMDTLVLLGVIKRITMSDGEPGYELADARPSRRMARAR